MHPIIKNILAVIAGWIGGSAVNMGLVQLGHSIYPMEGVDPNDMQALAEALPQMDFQYFIFPFLAHALGTLVGAFIAALIAANHQMKFALGIGGIFLIGGILVNIMLPGPTWFAITDIALAYIPMAWIGGRLGMTIRTAQ